LVKADIFSGFLGAGKTTLIKKLVAEAYAGEKLVLIENEFGDVGIDGGFMKEAGIEITEMSSGCICCSLVGDFSEALAEVCEKFSPDRILIEPSGVGKLSDVIKAVSAVPGIEISGTIAVADAVRCKMYARNFGEFYDDQIGSAGAIVLSRTEKLSEDKLKAALSVLHERNGTATIITTPWSEIGGKQILESAHKTHTLQTELDLLKAEEAVAHAHKHHHHNEPCDCGHDHHDEPCDCGCGHDHHSHGAAEVFSSWGAETARKFTAEDLGAIFEELDNSAKYGAILRAKGIVAGQDSWLHFDFVPGEGNVRSGSAEVTGRLCVIGSGLNTGALQELFNI